MIMRRVATIVAVIGLALGIVGCGGDEAKPVAPATTVGTSSPAGDVKSKPAGEAAPQAVTPAVTEDREQGTGRDERGVSQVGFERSSYKFHTYHSAGVSECAGNDNSVQICTYLFASAPEAEAALLATEGTTLNAGGRVMSLSWPVVFVNNTAPAPPCTAVAPCVYTKVSLVAVSKIPGSETSTLSISCSDTGNVVRSFQFTVERDYADQVARLLAAGGLGINNTHLTVVGATLTYRYNLPLPS